MYFHLRLLGVLLLFFGGCFALPFSLTPEDSAWIRLHPVVRVGIDRNRSPIEFVDGKGVHQGISSDALDYIAKHTGIRFETIVDKPWKVIQDEIRARKIDMLASARPTESRKEYLKFTDAYLQIPTVIVVRKGTRYVESVKDLVGLRIAVVRGNASTEPLLKLIEKGNIKTYESYRDALVGLSRDEADAMVGNLVVLTHEIQNMDAPVRIAAPTNFTTALAMGVRSDWPELTSILNRTLASLSEGELAGMKSRWVNSPVVIGVPWKDVIQMGVVLFIAFAFVVSTILWTNRKLKREIAERKNAERRALENEKNYHSLFHNLDQAFSVQELVRGREGEPIDYKYMEVNSAYCNLLGMELTQVIGKTNGQIGFPSDPDWLNLVTQVAETGNALQVERQFPRNGRWVRCSIFSSQRNTFAMILTDITDQKNRLVDLTSQRDEMSHFIYSISHDLKGPILTITSFGQMLRDDLVSGNVEDVDRDLGFIHKAAERMSLLLEGLLEVAKLGRVELLIKTCSVEELVRESAGLVEGKFRETGLVLRSVEKNAYFDVDHARMIQVFQNLLENAAKYRNPEGESWVDVKVERRGSELTIVVQDNGQGIPLNKTNCVFNIFEKVDNQSQGSGIGLALVKRIVELHKGHIWVESAGLGKGASFCISLPSLRLQS